MTIDDVPEEIKKQIIEENQRKQMCYKCHSKWSTYLAFVPYRGEIPHCCGCNKPVEKCTC